MAGSPQKAPPNKPYGLPTRPSSLRSSQERLIKHLMLLCLILGGTLALSVVANLLQASKSIPPSEILAVDSKGRITKLVPVSKWTISDVLLKQFVKDSLEDTFLFNFRNSASQFERTGLAYFTENGRNSFGEYLSKSGIYDQVLDKGLLCSAIVTNVMIDEQNSGVDKTGFWAFKTIYVRVEINLANQTKVLPQVRELKMVIRRMDSLENANMMAIEHVVESQENRIQLER